MLSCGWLPPAGVIVCGASATLGVPLPYILAVKAAPVGGVPIDWPSEVLVVAVLEFSPAATVLLPEAVWGCSGNSLTSKVAIVSRSSRPDADVDYLFAQVAVERAHVDLSPNCGNMLSAVGPFAIEAGLVPAVDGETMVRIHNRNTGALIEAAVQTPGGALTRNELTIQ